MDQRRKRKIRWEDREADGTESGPKGSLLHMSHSTEEQVSPEVSHDVQGSRARIGPLTPHAAWRSPRVHPLYPSPITAHGVHVTSALQTIIS